MGKKRSIWKEGTRRRQARLTDFFRQPQQCVPPKKVLLKGGEIRKILAEVRNGKKIHLHVEQNGRQNLIAILERSQFDALLAVPPANLSLDRLREVLPDVPEDALLLLNGALLELYRERGLKNAESERAWSNDRTFV